MSKKIAVVDDDPVIRILVTEYLSAYGHDVQSFANGPECLAHLKRELPDILILDLQMPEMNGIEVLQHIRTTPSMKELPVLMLSANNDTAKVLATHRMNAEGYLQKPFEIKNVLEAIQTLTAKAPQATV